MPQVEAAAILAVMRANAFENALTSHVLAPLLRAMITIAVAFDSEPSTIGAFDDHIDAIPQRTDLRTHAVSELQQSSHHVALEFGIHRPVARRHAVRRGALKHE